MVILIILSIIISKAVKIANKFVRRKLGGGVGWYRDWADIVVVRKLWIKDILKKAYCNLKKEFKEY
jgi:hypothetical protein